MRDSKGAVAEPLGERSRTRVEGKREAEKEVMRDEL